MENEQPKTIFADGIIFSKPMEGAPEFIRGKLSFKVDEVVEFLKKYKPESGWVNCDLCKSKEGKLYLKLNQFKPKTEKLDDDGFKV